MSSTAWTIGHSTRPLKSFLELLAHYRLEAVVDVRRFPGSRRQPQFASEPLHRALAEQGIAYQWIAALGGRRRPRPDSPNITWRNVSFRGYADYIASAEFAEGLGELLEVAGRLRTTMMCAEAVWWRCHRALISDVLCVQGIEVVHILDETHTVVHPYTSPARIVKGRLTYVPTEGEPLGHPRGLTGQKRRRRVDAGYRFRFDLLREPGEVGHEERHGCGAAPAHSEDRPGERRPKNGRP